MKNITAAEIEKLCQESYDLSSGQYPLAGMNRLLKNGVEFHNLSYSALCSSIVGLSKTLLRPGLNSYSDQDQAVLWSWCAQILLGSQSDALTDIPYQINSLYNAAVNSALAEYKKPLKNISDLERENIVSKLQSIYEKNYLHDASLVLSYLSFPLLEFVLRRACKEYVSLEGKVVQEFSVKRKDGTERPYKVGAHCNKIRDLLILFSGNIDCEDRKNNITSLRSHLSTIDPDDPYDLIDSWRNRSLHGETNFHTVGGILLNICFLISLFEIEEKYERCQSVAIAHLNFIAEIPENIEFPKTFYRFDYL